MQTTRRDVFKFVGGSALGAFLTPAPWRLITDTALWSENWPGIPRPARGEIRARYTHCSLCPAGCAVRARCVGDQPVSLTGVKDHPLSRGALCPWGIAAHQLPYSPARLRRGARPEAEALIREAIGHCRSHEHVALLDLRPGRTASWTYRRALSALPNGVYVANPAPEWGYDLAAARTVLSLGAPLADGWGTPGNVFAARPHFRLFQADAVETRTAALADIWLPVRAGSEFALAAAVAGDLSAADAASATGAPEQLVRDIMAELRANGPSLVLAPTASPEVMRANIALGAPGKTVVARRETPAPKAWQKAARISTLDEVEDGSIRVLFIDESAPYVAWPSIALKLAPDAPLVVTFAVNEEGYGRHSRLTLPAPVSGESLDDIPAAADGVTAVFRLAVPIVAPQAPVVNPPEFVARLAGLDAGQALRERADAIHQDGCGQVFSPADGKLTGLKDLSADDFWKALNAGACWMDERETKWGRLATGGGLPTRPSATVESAALRRLKTGAQDTILPRSDLPLAIVVGESSGPPLASPLNSKLYRESNLRQAPNRAALAPATARAAGLAEGSRAWIETRSARLPVVIAIDPGLPPDVVRVAASARLCDLEGPSARGKVVAA